MKKHTVSIYYILIQFISFLHRYIEIFFIYVHIWCNRYLNDTTYIACKYFVDLQNSFGATFVNMGSLGVTAGCFEVLEKHAKRHGGALGLEICKVLHLTDSFDDRFVQYYFWSNTNLIVYLRGWFNDLHKRQKALFLFFLNDFFEFGLTFLLILIMDITLHEF